MKLLALLSVSLFAFTFLQADDTKCTGCSKCPVGCICGCMETGVCNCPCNQVPSCNKQCACTCGCAETGVCTCAPDTCSCNCSKNSCCKCSS